MTRTSMTLRDLTTFDGLVTAADRSFAGMIVAGAPFLGFFASSNGQSPLVLAGRMKAAGLPVSTWRDAIMITATVTDGRLEVEVPADWPDGTEVEVCPLARSVCRRMLQKYKRTPILVALAVLIGCTPHAARVAEESTPRLEQLVCDTADFATATEAAAATATEDNIEVLREREKALTALRAAGVFWGHPEEPHLAARTRVTRFATEVLFDQLGLRPHRGTDALTDKIFLDNVRWFPEIKSLTLSSTDLTDEGMKAVLKMPNLESFWLLHHYPPEHPCLITDEGMKALAQCTALRELRIVGTKLTDIGVEHLSRLPDLRRIYMEATYITPNSLRYLVSMPHLEEISIWGNRGAFGELSYADIADYDRLGTAMTPGAAKAMASAVGVSRRVLIGSTLAVDPSVVEALCRTPTVEQISIRTYASWIPPPSIFAALHEQHHLKWLNWAEEQLEAEAEEPTNPYNRSR
jgi:hypothetical protein